MALVNFDPFKLKRNINIGLNKLNFTGEPTPEGGILGGLNFEEGSTRLNAPIPKNNAFTTIEGEREINTDATGGRRKLETDEGGGFFDSVFPDGLDLGELSGYIVPGIDSLVSANKSQEFYKDAQATTTDLNLNAGTVSDLAKPNFAQPTRAPQGSSLAENTAAQKFGDVQQVGQEAQYELENSASRIAQRDKILGIQNQEELAEFQDEVGVKRFNNQVGAQRGATKEARAQEALIGLTQNFQSGSAQRGYNKNNKLVQTASSLIKAGKIVEGMKLLGMDTTGVSNG